MTPNYIVTLGYVRLLYDPRSDDDDLWGMYCTAQLQFLRDTTTSGPDTQPTGKPEANPARAQARAARGAMHEDADNPRRGPVWVQKPTLQSAIAYEIYGVTLKSH